ncbi:MAG: hypothetical protein ABSD28_07275 [Tepidisphaeraceae bacterium]
MTHLSNRVIGLGRIRRARQTSSSAAIFSGLTSTCRRHGIDPQHYLTQPPTNLPATQISEWPDRLPDQWKRRNPAP